MRWLASRTKAATANGVQSIDTKKLTKGEPWEAQAAEDSAIIQTNPQRRNKRLAAAVVAQAEAREEILVLWHSLQRWQMLSVAIM